MKKQMPLLKDRKVSSSNYLVFNMEYVDNTARNSVVGDGDVVTIHTIENGKYNVYYGKIQNISTRHSNIRSFLTEADSHSYVIKLDISGKHNSTVVNISSNDIIDIYDGEPGTIPRDGEEDLDEENINPPDDDDDDVIVPLDPPIQPVEPEPPVYTIDEIIDACIDKITDAFEGYKTTNAYQDLFESLTDIPEEIKILACNSVSNVVLSTFNELLLLYKEEELEPDEEDPEDPPIDEEDDEDEELDPKDPEEDEEPPIDEEDPEDELPIEPEDPEEPDDEDEDTELDPEEDLDPPDEEPPTEPDIPDEEDDEEDPEEPIDPGDEEDEDEELEPEDPEEPEPIEP